jgi:hypothetical protein
MRTIVVVAVVVVAAAVALAASGRVPLLARAWETVATAVASSPLLHAPSGSPEPSPADAGSPGGDAGPAPRRQAGPLSSAQLGAPLVHGGFVSACRAPDDMKVVVTLTVKMGRAGAVTVTTIPPDPAVASCVERAVRDQRWDVSPHVGHLTVTY